MSINSKNAVIMAVLIVVSVVAYRTALMARLASWVAYPVLQGYRVAMHPLKQWRAHRETVWQLRSQLHEQEQELADLRAQNIYLRASMAYMQGVDELRRFKNRYEMKGTIAHVLARNFSEQSHHFYIDLGAHDAIEKDMVVTYKNNLIGKVTEVYPWYSKVCLITDRQCKVAAYGATTRVHGIHEGSNQCGETSLCHVSHLTTVKRGELVFSSGEGLLFPEGLALGRITSCCTKGLYQEVGVTPLCNLKELEHCMVQARG